MPAESVVEYVTASGARSAVLAALGDSPRDAAAVIEAVEVRDSAVYRALSDLADEALVRETNGGWRRTGAGEGVAALVDGARDGSAVLSTDREYWATHDLAAVPEPFRRRIDALAGCEVARAPADDPYRVVERVEAVFRAADSIDVVSSVTHPPLRRAMDESDPDGRLVASRSVVDENVEAHRSGEYDRPVDIRVVEHDVDLVVTDREVVLTLLTPDGEYDQSGAVFADGDRALAWGRGLFEHFWQRATPLVEYVER